jgi:PAS domain S-box-containing protein
MVQILPRHPAVRITLFYLAIALVWAVLFGWQSFRWLGSKGENSGWWLMAENVGFALASAAILFALVRRELGRRQRAEHALERSERLFHTLARLAPVGVFRSDRRGACVYVNQAWSHITGVPPFAAAGEGWATTLHPEDRREILARWQECVDHLGSFRGEYRFLRPDGSVAWVLGEVHPEDDGLGFVGTITDITDRKEAEIALRASENRYRTLVENIPAVTLTLSLEPGAGPVFVSPQIEELTGTSAAEWMSDPARWWRQVHPEDRERVQRELSDAHRRSVGCEFRFLRYNGAQCIVRFEGAFLRDEQGHPLALHGLMFDLTAARETEAALRATHRTYEALVDSIEGVVWEMSATTLDYTFVSLQAERMLGYHRERWTREPRFWANRVHPQDLSRVEAFLWQTVANRRPADIEYRLRAADGRELWVRDIVSPVEDDGQVRRLCGATFDITESRRVARELANINEELERRVRERTSELEAANEELRSFSYSVSHDLRAPLRAITGFGDALQTEYGEHLDATGRDYLQRMQAAARRMSQLIEDLIDLSRVTRVEMNRETFDLSELATAVVTELRHAEPQREVAVRIEPGICVKGDVRLMRLALENLIGNAWKFTAKREHARIEIGTLRGPRGRRTVYVRDNGAGFEMEYAHKLFTPFQRLHNPSEFAGTGIGLATVQRIIHRHGSRIWAEGREGAGATFYFEM